MEPSEGERRAVVGFSGQYRLAAEIVYRGLSGLDWIRLADPSVGVADDFQFKSGPTRHALQVKWSQYPGMFGWADLTSPSGDSPALLSSLAAAWLRIRLTWDGPLLVHLCSNDVPTPNFSTAADNPLKLATTSAPKHFAAFLETSWRPVRDAVLTQRIDLNTMRSLSVYSEWSDAWERLREVTNLSDDDFVRFLTEFAIELGMSTTPMLEDANREADIDALAQTIQEIVVDASRPMQLARSALIDRLGWRDRLQYRHRHQFPVPATYVANQTAQDAIGAAFDQVAGGYLAVVGPAGCGKSTLLSDMSFRGRVIRYYAFVPDSPDPLSGRGEAESFLSDLSLALQDSGIGRPTLPAGLQNLRIALHDQLATAADIWKKLGERTLIIVDGLDHVPREQRPFRSMLEELPGPAALGDGVYILLGTQATTILPEPIQAALSADARRFVEVPPLTENEVRLLVQKSLADLPIDTELSEALVAASAGHPLALTYITQEVLRVTETHADDAATRDQRLRTILQGANAFGDDINERYRGYFKAVEDDADVKQLLGVVARLRTAIRIDWLRTWASAAAVSQFLAKASPFFWHDGDVWTFIHNSFRRFLLDETAKVGGSPDARLDRDLHVQIADRCAESSGEWAIYRDEEIAHRFLAEQYGEVVAIATPKRLRDAIGELKAMPTVVDHASLGLRSAAKSENREAFVGLFILLGELQQRTQVLSDEQLASAMIRMLPPSQAVDYVVRGGKLQIAVSDAIRHAAAWSTDGHGEIASLIIKAAHGLPGLLALNQGRSEMTELIENWAEATFGTSGLETVLVQIDRHLAPIGTITGASAEESELSTSPGDDEQSQIRQWRIAALMRCFDLLLEVRDEFDLARVSQILDDEAPPDLRAWLRIKQAGAALKDGFMEEAARWVDEVLAIDGDVQTSVFTEESDDFDEPTEASISRSNDDERTGAELRRVPLALRLRAALILLQTGHANESVLERIVGWDEQPTEAGDFYREAWEAQRLYRLHLLVKTIRLLARRREGYDTPDIGPTSIDRSPDPGSRRFDFATKTLISLQASHIAHRLGLSDERPYVAAMSDPILRVHEVPHEQSQHWTGWYRIRQSMSDMLNSLISLAHRAGGTVELTKLAARFDEAWTGERRRYWSMELRQNVIAAYASLDPASHDWVRVWLSRLGDELADSELEPSELVEMWLKHAQISADLGLLDVAHEDVVNATAAAGRIGYSQDEHQLAHWVTWLDGAFDAGEISRDEFLSKAADYASRVRAVASANSEAASSAAEKLIASIWRVSPRYSVQVGETLCDLGVLDEAQMIQAAVIASFQDTECALDMSVRVATKILLPIAKYPSAELRAALVARQDAHALREFDIAIDIWTIDRPYVDRLMSGTERDAAPQGTGADSEPEDPANSNFVSTRQGGAVQQLATPQALLTFLRPIDHAETLSQDFWAAACTGALRAPMTAPVARSLLQQAQRLNAPDGVIGLLAQTLADGGDVDIAVDALQARLSRLPAYGWFGEYDGGSRQTILRASLSTRNPALVQLAADDLARAITSEKTYWRSFSSDTKRVLELAVGADAVAGAWPAAEAYLDIHAPAIGDVSPSPLGEACLSLPDTSSTALGILCGNLLAHPARAVETGARRVLLGAMSFDAATAAAVLQDSMNGNGWQAEAALQTIAAGPGGISLNSLLVEDIRRFAVGADAILRDLARIIAARNGIECANPAPRELPLGYTIFVPPELPRRQPPELDREGTPFVDLSDPQQVIAPNDSAMRVIAERLDLEPATVLYRASQLAQRPQGNRWTDEGVKGMANRLKRRGQKHFYRPWAYMVGRRAAGQVLAELRDAFADDVGREVALSMGMVAPHLIHVEPIAIPQDDPGPWKTSNTDWSSTASWCDEVTSATAAYGQIIEKQSDIYLLAEHSEWRILEWGTPGEVREVLTTHGAPPSALELSTDPEPWEFVSSSRRYPRLSYDWSDHQLVVHGREGLTDAPYLFWWALHPAVAKALRWQPATNALFGWAGADGFLRAKTEYSARGLMSHHPPAAAWSAEVWRVTLTRRGLEEIREAFPYLRRRLEVTRTVPERPRDNEDERTSKTSLPLREPA